MASSERQAVVTKEAPGPYPALSQAVVHNGLVFCSGSIGMDPATNTIAEGTIAERTTQALTNLSKVLQAAGSGSDKVLKVMIYVTSMDDVPLMNEAYNKFFAEPRPARACICVKALARGTDVEMECTGFI
ncbi:hypothetical protein N7478_002239 [Penicillium angulare]|uniref:uncharacterized protein n=1 Tax=Penicillium angulare TaxID=116970 RepID=UPI00254194E8|nr:uncharacterized protein N7478_002239 [Penicillium angulare]KAJ5289209.1 hypothetical protein N7478_002239 [Penicillium angulare]